MSGTSASCLTRLSAEQASKNIQTQKIKIVIYLPTDNFPPHKKKTHFAKLASQDDQI